MFSQNKPYNLVRFLISICFHVIITYKVGKTMEQHVLPVLVEIKIYDF